MDGSYIPAYGIYAHSVAQMSEHFTLLDLGKHIHGTGFAPACMGHMIMHSLPGRHKNIFILL